MSSTQQTILPPPGGGTGQVDHTNLTLHARRYLKIVAKRWFILVGCLLVSTSWYSYKAVKSPDMFSARSVIVIGAKVQRYDAGPRLLEEMSSFYINNQELMTDSAVISEVNASFEKENPLLLGTIVSREPRRGAGASFILNVTGTNLRAVESYAKIWADEFIKYKEKVHNSKLGKAALQTKDEVNRLTRDLAAAQSNTAAFLKSNNIISITETREGAQSRLDRAVAEQRDYRIARITLEQRTAAEIASELGGEITRPDKSSTGGSAKDNRENSPRLVNESQYNLIRARLNDTEQERDRRRATLKDKHPVIVKLTAEISKLEKSLQSELDLIDARRKARVRELKLSEDALEPVIKEERERVERLNNLKREHEFLVAEETRIKSYLEPLQKELVGFNLSDKDEETFEVRPGINSGPAGPDRRKMVITGILYGFALGIGIIYFLHRLDDRLELAQDIETELEEPVLGQIPQVDPKTIEGGRLLVTRFDQHNFFSESIRGIRSAVMFGSQGDKKQVMLVTSAVPGDGKTTFTVNFAATLALAGHQVLLVDADLRRGNIHNYFQQKRDPGFAEVLAGEQHWEDVVCHTEVKTLDTISTGALPANPGELLISPIARQFVDEVRKHYDYVVFDCPPLTAIDDTFSLVGLSDGMMFVVRAGQTSMRFAKNALAAIRQRGASIFGIVLNGITADNPYYHYNNYYHAYYNKGKASIDSTRRTTPGTQMASRRARTPANSIEAQAKARARENGIGGGEAPTESKTEIFRRRRAAQAAGEAAPGPEAKPESSASDAPEGGAGDSQKV